MRDDGSKAILAQIRAVRDAIGGEALAEGGQEWADEQAVPMAQANVPVLTGATRDATAAEAGPGGINLYSATPYAGVIEYGGLNRMAHPYMEPAVRSTIGLLARYLGFAIDRRVK